MSNVKETKRRSRTSEEARSDDPAPSDARSSLAVLAGFTRRILRVSKSELEITQKRRDRLEHGT